MSDELLGAIADHPLSAISVILAVYAASASLHERLERPIVLEPVLVSIIALIVVLRLADVQYDAFFSAAKLLHVMLPAAFTLLSVALWRHRSVLSEAPGPLAIALGAGVLVGFLTAITPPLLMHNSYAILATLCGRVMTIPVAAPLVEAIGGLPSLAAIVIVASGVLGAAFGPAVLCGCGVRDERAVGLALGAAAHALGTARAFRVSERAGAFAIIGMMVNSVVSVPLVLIVIGSGT